MVPSTTLETLTLACKISENIFLSLGLLETTLEITSLSPSVDWNGTPTPGEVIVLEGGLGKGTGTRENLLLPAVLSSPDHLHRVTLVPMQWLDGGVLLRVSTLHRQTHIRCLKSCVPIGFLDGP